MQNVKKDWTYRVVYFFYFFFLLRVSRLVAQDDEEAVWVPVNELGNREGHHTSYICLSGTGRKAGGVGEG